MLYDGSRCTFNQLDIYILSLVCHWFMISLRFMNCIVITWFLWSVVRPDHHQIQLRSLPKGMRTTCKVLYRYEWITCLLLTKPICSYLLWLYMRNCTLFSAIDGQLRISNLWNIWKRSCQIFSVSEGELICHISCGKKTCYY